MDRQISSSVQLHPQRQLRRLCPRRIFATSAMNPGQEGLWWGHGHGLAPPTIKYCHALASGNLKVSLASVGSRQHHFCFLYFYYVNYTTSSTSTVSARQRANRGDDKARPAPKVWMLGNRGSEAYRTKYLHFASSKTYFIIETEAIDGIQLVCFAVLVKPKKLRGYCWGMTQPT